MRGIYKVQTLDDASSAPLLKKVFGTFSALTIILALLAMILFIGLTNVDPESQQGKDFIYTLGGVLVGLVVAQISTLFFLIRTSIIPLLKIVTWAHKTTELREFKIPQRSSEELVQIYEIMNDYISRLKKAQEDLIATERNAAIAQTVQMLAHDIRKPFSFVRIFQNLISKASSMQEVQTVIVKFNPELDKAMKQVNIMLEDVLDFRINPTLEKKPLMIERLIEECIKSVAMVEDSDKKNAISWNFDYAHTASFILNEQKMQRVIMNILQNAIEAMNGSGEVFISTSTSDQNVLRIRNTNSSIDHDFIDRVFEPYFTSGKSHGTGLGLAVAKTVVENHGGTIACFSDSGVTFELRFPKEF